MTLETVVLQVTTRCPYHCPQCYMQKGNEDMSLDVAKAMIDQAAKDGAGAIQITGGEPLIYPHLQELIRYAAGKKLYTLLATSGYDNSAETYMALKRAGVTAICVSINDIDEQKNRLSREAFGASLTAVRTARACGLMCFANVVVSDDNVRDLSLLGDYLSEKGVYGVQILRPIPSFDGAYSPQISQETIETIQAVVAQSPEFYHVENCYVEYWKHVRGEFCCSDAGCSAFFVNVNGEISPCSKTTAYKYDTPCELLERRAEWSGGVCR